MKSSQFRCVVVLCLGTSLALAGCGASVSQLPEVWDRTDGAFSTSYMEVQIKRAIYCQLRVAAVAARSQTTIKRTYKRKEVTNPDDEPFPDSWGVQVTLTLAADEKSSFSPGASIKNPLSSATVLLSSGPQVYMQSYATAIGGTVSSQNQRSDKYDFYYSGYHLTHPVDGADLCDPKYDHNYGPKNTSSPFVDASNLGIVEWLPTAVVVSQFARSSRKAPNGEGPALGNSGAFASDSATYDNKFIIVTSGNATPIWSLVRVATSSSPLFDLNRTRTHDLLITVGPETVSANQSKNAAGAKASSLSLAAQNSHLASQIGNAVAAAIRAQ